MFSLLKFDTTSLTVRIIFDNDSGVDSTVEQNFDNESQMKRWLSKVRVEYIRHKITNYITHKKILSGTSRSWCTPENRATKLRALDILLKELELWKDCPLDIICRSIVLHEKNLTLILPEYFTHEEEHKLRNIIEFSKEVAAWQKIIA